MFEMKIVALLHDPPDKPWLLVKSANHEDEALTYVQKLTNYKSIPNDVRQADRLASGIDRFALSMVMGGKYAYGFLSCDKVVLRNPINPLFEVELPREIDENKVNNFKNELFKILEPITDVKLRYLLLYSIYEALWIDHDLPIGPADTRVPTHTTFDHNYATATAINWISEDAVEGLLVGIDVAGVKRFVSFSRKLRDAWASSYLVSALVWYAILPLIDRFGPDISITPSLRFNPFFLHWLAKRLDARGLGDFIKERLIYKFVYLEDEHLISLYKELNLPPYACLPERATLVLPNHPKEEVERGLRKHFENGWQVLWRAVTLHAKMRAERDVEDIVWKFIDRVFKYYDEEFKDAGFDQVPPLTPRVEVVKAEATGIDYRLYDEKYRELARKLSLRKLKRIEPEANLNLAKLTEKAFTKPVGFPRKSRRGFEYCTCCSKLPALLVLPSGEGERPQDEEYGFYVYASVEKGWSSEEIDERWRNIKGVEAQGSKPEELKEFENWLQSYRAQIQVLKSILTPGERLCPWCFLKRVLSMEPRLFNVLIWGLTDQGSIEEYVKNLSATQVTFSFPSTSDLASLRLRERLVELLDENKLSTAHLLKGLPQIKEENLQAFLRAAARKNKPWLIERLLCDRVEKSKLDDYAKTILKGLIKADPENLWFASDLTQRRSWQTFLRELNLTDVLCNYYTIILADGDSIGKLIEGDLTAFHNTPGMEEDGASLSTLALSIVKRWGACELEKLLIDLLRDDKSYEEKREHWKNVLSRQLKIEVQEAEQHLDSVRSLLNQIINRKAVPISISYHSSLSSALSRAAILDSIVVSRLGGVIVYAGGDDLLAFTPVDTAVKLAYVSRRLFAGALLREQHEESRCLRTVPHVVTNYGFFKMKKALLPMLPGVGRSYCVLVTHFMYPLYLAMQQASSALEEAKNQVSVELKRDGVSERWMKDMVAFVYVPRGKIELTFVPETLHKSIHIAKSIIKAVEYLDEIGVTLKAANKLLQAVPPLGRPPTFSISLLNDIEEIDRNLVEAARALSNPLVESLMDHVLNRNRRKSTSPIRWRKFSTFIETLHTRYETLLTCIVSHGNKSDGSPVATGARGESHVFTTVLRAVRYLRGGLK